MIFLLLPRHTVSFSCWNNSVEHVPEAQNPNF